MASCVDCNADFEPAPRCAGRCRGCFLAHERERGREYYERVGRERRGHRKGGKLGGEVAAYLRDKPERPTLVCCNRCGSFFEPKKRGHAAKRCPSCRPKRNRHRESSTQRGYGNEHQKERRRYKALMDQGEQFFCPECGKWVPPDRDWHLAHDHRNGGYLGPAHPRCNMRESVYRNKPHLKGTRRSREW